MPGPFVVITASVGREHLSWFFSPHVCGRSPSRWDGPLSRPLALYRPSEKWVPRVSLPYRGVPAPLTPSASTRTVETAIFLGSLRSLPANLSGSSEDGEGKGVSFPSSAGRHGCPSAGQGWVQNLAHVTMSATVPSGKGEAHEEVPVSFHSSPSDVLPDRQVLSQNLNPVPRTEDIWSNAVFLSMCMSRAQPCEVVRLAEYHEPKGKEYRG